MSASAATAPLGHAEPAEPAGIALGGVTKRFGSTAAVDAISLDIAQGEFFAVVGASGCGKSTLLRLVAGLERLDAGTLALAGRTVAAPGIDVPPEARGVAVVFQSYALWPHMSVAKNVAFPTEAAGMARNAAREIVDGALRAVDLSPLAERKPAALSGGQQQRVALARCLASRARTVLMDEPLANLDPHLRAAMEGELTRFHAASEATTLYITHDQREAMALATRIAVMQAGRFLQVDTPEAIYERPASRDVARFIGRGSLVEGRVAKVMGERARFTVGASTFEVGCRAGTGEGPATLMLRPHQIRLGEDGALAGTVERAVYRGGTFELAIAAPECGEVAAEARTKVPIGPVRFSIAGGWVLPS